MSFLEENSTLVLASIFAAAVGIVGFKLLSSDTQSLRRIQEQRKILQSVEISKGKKGEGGVRRAPKYAKELLVQYDPKIITLVDMFNDTATKFGSLPSLGVRKKEGKSVGPYEWITYNELKKRRDDLGSGLALLGQTKGSPVGIYSINRPEWLISDLACSLFGLPSVALYDTLGPDAVIFILNHAEISVVIASGGKQLNNILSAKKKCENLKFVICMDPLTEEDKKQAKEVGVELYEINEVMKMGSEKPQNSPQISPDDIYTIMYTSGTTGNPKGVVLTHKNGISEIAAIRAHEENLYSENDVHMSYLPLAHSFERVVTYALLSYGARIGYFQGVITELFNDIAELKPTFLIGAPRVWNRLYDKIQVGLSSSSIVRKKLFQWAYDSKKQALETGQSTSFWDTLVFSKIKARLGGRVRWILSGSAPLDTKLAEFLKICFGCPILEGYGLTENFAGAFITHLNETQFGHVGSPLGCIEVKLQDIPEMDYSSENSPPKGEIMLRGANVFREYYKDPKQTKEALEDDGWFHTGDVGKWNENGTLSIIDRKKNIFKLEQGEYVAVEYLEGVYLKSKYVSQIWVYGSSFKRYLIAVVVPDPEVVIPWAKQQGIENTGLPSLCSNEKLRNTILEDLTALAKSSKLNGFEFIKAITLSPESFSVDNDTMTPTFKLRRPQLQKRFQKQIDEMYAIIDAQQQPSQ